MVVGGSLAKTDAKLTIERSGSLYQIQSQIKITHTALTQEEAVAIKLCPF